MSRFGNTGKLSVPIKTGIQLLEMLEEESKQLIEQRNITRAKFNGYCTLLEGYADKIFGENSPKAEEFSYCYVEEHSYMTESNIIDSRLDFIQEKIEQIKSLKKILKIDIDNNSDKKDKKEQSLGESIFIVHGHDTEVLNRVKKILDRLHLRYTVLHEQPNEGRTLIEKFEKNAQDIGFAIVIMTGDDKGGSKNNKSSEYKNRARQNVILELGFFLGKIERKRVCILLEEGVEKPSDYEGVAYTPLKDDCQLPEKLAKELKAAGFKIDENKLQSKESDRI